VLKQHLSDEEILIFTYLINAYSLHATATRALRLEFDDVPERVVEVPAPGDDTSDSKGSSDRTSRRANSTQERTVS
jgi:hypothetical protein